MSTCATASEVSDTVAEYSLHYLLRYMTKPAINVSGRPVPWHACRSCEECGCVLRGPRGRLARPCERCGAYYCSEMCRHAAWHSHHWRVCGVSPGAATKMSVPGGSATVSVTEDMA